VHQEWLHRGAIDEWRRDRRPPQPLILRLVMQRINQTDVPAS
jgi:hypothetical protein